MRKMTGLFAVGLLAACHGNDVGLTSLDGVEVQPGQMAGDMPEVDAFEDALTIDVAEISGTWLDLDLQVEGDYGWAMVAGEVDLWDYVDPDDATIELGTEIIVDDYDLWDWVGCSGPEAGWADFDESPDAVRLTFVDPADAGLVPEGTEVGTDFVGVVVDSVWGTDAVRAVTLARVR